MLRAKKNYSGLILIIGIFVFAGCASKELKNIHSDTVNVPPTVRQQAVSGSLWPGESTNSLICSDQKARYINDIVTIMISETSAGGNKASTNTSRDTNTSAAITSLFWN